MSRMVRVVRKVKKRVRVAEVYAMPETGRFLNVALLAATPEVDVDAMKEAAWQRQEKKK